ncbi:glucose facilitated diffusion protein [Zymomonas mobilis subsp. mobilis ZM4 = ATCC 31821]|uniref:Glucose facilitated diffusion protein n=2 Tax=Zymomonas mobilis subsp. mobilis TaxID=120045 RepID=GLF_ZYMMO|nr:sugar porter family MFS transporter [Zymomonas mobilis]P21906.2 RecName: Full=Glucose facilitated diffusion protein [Zymomonas mobilis subsp. mobilis ZM4 = ATCC 31821]AAV88990.1 sugar transporter [Zymomonas mobilis subsp. mobilis ZM4 = ATCC 31821]ACV75420.1 sugar transporter [Zymomonas mobilis subsp. mobilis NCIMB 11163]AEH62742.1 sugar transporter [Zymomonas mobilis subsp. mobilis ATCC 10988]AHB10206.1 MFS transporter, sugar porter family [Zymomonas mobilis subsp. mobilis str. CP4 = NRRL B
MSSESSQGLVTRLALIAAIGGLLFGYDSAVIAAIGTPVDIHFIAPRHLSATAAASLSGMVVVAVLVGCVTGSLLSGWIGIRFGRRGGLLMSSICFVAAGFGAALTEKLFGTGGSALQIFCFFRFLAGLGIGVVSTLTPTYIAEIAPPDKRGQMVSGQQMAIVTGALTGYIFTWLLAHFGSIDWVNASGWCWSPASEGLIGIAFLLLLLTAPDTPHWLVMKGRHSEASKILARLEPQADPNLTIQKIKAGFDKAMDKSSAGLFAFGITVVFAGVSVAAFQQLVGINAVLYYAPQMFQNLGFGADTALLQTISIGVVNFIFTMIASRVVDRFGRKPLLIWGALGMAAMMAVLGCCFWFKVGGVLPLASVLLYIAVFGMSWGPVCWVVLSEMFPSSIKGAAMPIAVTGQWLANILVNFLFKVADGSPALNQTFNHGFSYLVFAALSILGGLIVARFVPETKGRSLDEIEEMWRSQK